MITDIIVPPVGEGARSSYRKVRGRQAWDFAVAGVALALRFNGNRVGTARIVLSGAAPIPWRCVEAEQIMSGRELTPGVAAEAAAAAVRGAQPLEHNSYKVYLFRGLIEEELSSMAAG
jgi:xanthine dehydrogenase YagS FAD-binding subunit